MDDDYNAAHAPIFEGIARDTVERLCPRDGVVSFEAGQRLFERGQDAEELLILHEGVVELSFPVRILGATRELTMESKEAPEVVAWSAMIPPYRFTLGARCASRCVLTRLEREALHACFRDEPQAGCLFMRNLAGVIGRRLQVMQSVWMRDLQAGATKCLE